MKSNCTKSCIISFIAVFAFLYLYGMLVHGHLLMEDYQATANLWRTEEAMKELCWWWLVYYGVLSAVLVCWFGKIRCSASMACPTTADGKDTASTCCPIGSGGLFFGLKVGLLFGLPMAASYMYMPIPGELAIKWLFVGLIQGLGVGVILGITCRDSSCDMEEAPKTKSSKKKRK